MNDPPAGLRSRPEAGGGRRRHFGRVFVKRLAEAMTDRRGAKTKQIRKSIKNEQPLFNIVRKDTLKGWS